MLDLLLQGLDPTPDRANREQSICSLPKVWLQGFGEATDETINPPVGPVGRHHHATTVRGPSAVTSDSPVVSSSTASGAGGPMRATVVIDEPERERLWVLADRVFPAYASYRRSAAKVNRTIPIIQLTQRG